MALVTSRIPQNSYWKTGDIMTAQKMNEIYDKINALTDKVDDIQEITGSNQSIINLFELSSEYGTSYIVPNWNNQVTISVQENDRSIITIQGQASTNANRDLLLNGANDTSEAWLPARSDGYSCKCEIIKEDDQDPDLPNFAVELMIGISTDSVVAASGVEQWRYITADSDVNVFLRLQGRHLREWGDIGTTPKAKLQFYILPGHVANSSASIADAIASLQTETLAQQVENLSKEIQAINQLQSSQIEWFDGYLSNNAGEIMPEEGDFHRKYSERLYNLKGKLRATIKRTSSRFEAVFAYAYNSRNQFIAAETLLTGNSIFVEEHSYETSSSQWHTLPYGTAYIRLLYRTYGDASCKLIITEQPHIADTDQVIPYYWDQALQQVKEKVLKRDLNLESGDRFFFITDPHWRSQENKMSSNIISELANHFRTKLCLIGGDLVASTISNAQVGYEEIANYIRSFKNHSLRLFATAGNHDVIRTNILSETQVYNAMMKQMEDFCVTTGNLQGAYYDNLSRKVRYIQFRNNSLNDISGNTNLQQWLTDKCINLPDDTGWSIVLLSHAYWDNGVSTSNSQAWAKFFLRLKQNGAPIALWLVGHTHLDCHAVVSIRTTVDNGITTEIFDENTSSNTNVTKLLIVSTTTDNVSPAQTDYWNEQNGQIQHWSVTDKTPTTISKSNRADNTDKECAFDFIHLDTANKKVYFTRIGGWFTGVPPESINGTSKEPLSGDRAYNYETGAELNYETGAEKIQ